MNVDFPEKLQFLFEPARYKIAYGGRGGAKSWGFARALLLQGANKPLRILCARETQKSIADSVHKLLSDQVRELGLLDHYEIQQARIIGKKLATEFMFAGLKHNIDNIKSVESADIVWVEEAQKVSKTSWSTLIPTIRKDGSEIWASFNPVLETDDTYKRFIKDTPTGAKVVKVGWQDNPWFPKVLTQEMSDLKERDPDEYLHVWEGHCRRSLEGAVYAEELRLAEEQGRIGRVPKADGKPVWAVFDLGFGDSTSIWFVQSIGAEFRIIGYYENQFKKIGHYIEQMQQRGHVYSHIILPHDGSKNNLEADKTVEGHMRAAYPNATVRVLPRLGIKDGLEAARAIFGQCWFDEDGCEAGLHALRHYHYDKDPDTGITSKNPVHDESSHGADAFRYFAVAMQAAAPSVNYDDLYN